MLRIGEPPSVCALDQRPEPSAVLHPTGVVAEGEFVHAAPDLVEAAKDARDLLSREGQGTEAYRIWRSLRAAIAKAEGEA